MQHPHPIIVIPDSPPPSPPPCIFTRKALLWKNVYPKTQLLIRQFIQGKEHTLDITLTREEATYEAGFNIVATSSSTDIHNTHKCIELGIIHPQYLQQIDSAMRDNNICNIRVVTHNVVEGRSKGAVSVFLELDCTDTSWNN